MSINIYEQRKIAIKADEGVCVCVLGGGDTLRPENDGGPVLLWH